MHLPVRLAVPGSIALCLSFFFAMGAGLAGADSTVSFVKTINPPATSSFDIGFVDGSAKKYFLADRTNNAVDLFDAAASSFTGYIGKGVFVGVVSASACTAMGSSNSHSCSGPNGVLTDDAGLVWAGDGNSTIKVLNPTPGTTDIKSIATGGKFRADEEAYDARDQRIVVANDAEGFLTFIDVKAQSVAGHFYYADNTVGKPATVAGHATAGGGIEQSVYDPQQGFFYQAVPAGTSPGFIDVFNPKSPQVPWLRSIPVPGCSGGPTGLALNPSTHEFLGACKNGAMLINANSGATTLIGSTATTGGADEVWFDAGSNNWYLSGNGRLGVVSAGPDHAVQDVVQTGCCGHSVAAFTASSSSSLIYDPNSAGTGISVFSATP